MKKNILIAFFLGILSWIMYMWIMHGTVIVKKNIKVKHKNSNILDNTIKETKKIKTIDKKLNTTISNDKILDINTTLPLALSEPTEVMDNIVDYNEEIEVEVEEPEFSYEDIEQYKQQIIEELERDQNRTFYSDEPRFTEEEIEEYKDFMTDDI